MKKRNIVILTLISSVISIVITLMAYFGISRYIMLHIQKPEHFTHSYSQLPKASDNKTIVCIKTSKLNLKKITPVINSILDQSVRVENIILLGVDDLPVDIKDFVSLYPSFSDDATENMLLQEKNAGTNIIILQDDILYGKDFIEKIVDKSNEFPDTIIACNSNKLIKPECYDRNHTKAKNTPEMLLYSENYKRM